MEYRATFKSNLGLVILALPICGFLIAVGATHHQMAMVILGVIPLAWFLAERLRLQVAINEDTMEYTGILSKKRIRLPNVIECREMGSLGFPWDQLYGPFTYRIRTPQESVKINFKVFPVECMREVLARIPDEFDE